MSRKGNNYVPKGDCGPSNKDWVPYKGKFKVIKLKTNMGVTPEMTISEYRKLHPNYKP